MSKLNVNTIANASGTTAATIDSSGRVITPVGIKLGSGTDILSSYVEGTWTPTNSAGVTLSISSSQYIRIGNLVFINAFINIPSTSASGGVVIGGVPYAPTGTFSVGVFNNAGLDLYAYMDTNGIYIRNSSNSTRTFANLSAKFVAFQITYYTTA